MTDYVINHRKHTFSYRLQTDEITIACYSLDNFTDLEITEFISDCLIHEHIHRAIYKFFDNITTMLFDAIEYLFRNDELHKRHLKGTKRFTYQIRIKSRGFNEFLDYYGLDNYDVLQANILCNTRKEVN